MPSPLQAARRLGARVAEGVAVAAIETEARATARGGGGATSRPYTRRVWQLLLVVKRRFCDH